MYFALVSITTNTKFSEISGLLVLIGCIIKHKLVYFPTEKTILAAMFSHSHKKQHSLEIWAVKHRFLLLYENMLKSIATARSECTAKHEKKASYNTDYIVLDLIDFFGDD